MVGRTPTGSATLKGGRPSCLGVDKITLDREVFKALASDTRLDILKALDVRQKTVTELAKELELNKATVFEHLEKLAAVGLIQKQEEDVERKWVYWQLTWTGRRLLHPEKITLAILLSSAMGTLLTAFAAAWMWWRSSVASPLAGDRDTTMADGLSAPQDGSYKAESGAPPPEASPSMRSIAADEAPAEGMSVPDAAHDPVYLAIAVVLALVFLALLGYAAYYWRKRRAAESATPAAA